MNPNQERERRRDDSIHRSMEGIDYTLGSKIKGKPKFVDTSVETPGEKEFPGILENLRRLTSFVPPEEKSK